MSLFKGRQDVFAIRWEKDNTSGYVPAYDLNCDEFRKHKEKDGSLKDFTIGSVKIRFTTSKNMANNVIHSN